MEHSESILIARPPEAVWALVGSIDDWPAWAKDVSEVQLPDGMAPGARVTYKYRGGDVSATITHYEHGLLVGIAAPRSGYDFWESIRLQPDGEGTRVSFTMGFDPTAWWTRLLVIPIRPLKRWVLGSPLRKELVALRTAAETSD